MYIRLSDSTPLRRDNIAASQFTKPSLKVLCLGDSLSAGTCLYGQEQHPYTGNVYLMLSDGLPRFDIYVDTDAIDDDCVHGGKFANRLAHRCREEKYDWAIILGGTNDLLEGQTPQTIFQSLKNLWDFARSKGLQVMALTIPDCAQMDIKMDQARLELNLMIMQYTETKFHPFDIASKIPYHSLSPEFRTHYWGDGTHLTEDGYDWMGGFIAQELIGLVRGHSISTTDFRQEDVVNKSPPRIRRIPLPTVSVIAANDINTRNPYEVPVVASFFSNPYGTQDTSPFAPKFPQPALPLTPESTISNDSPILNRRASRASETGLSSSEGTSRGSGSPVYSLATTAITASVPLTPPTPGCSSFAPRFTHSNKSSPERESHRRSFGSPRPRNDTLKSQSSSGGSPVGLRRAERQKHRNARRSRDMSCQSDEFYKHKSASPVLSEYVVGTQKDLP